MGTDEDALVGLDQNDLVLQPEGLGPLRRKAKSRFPVRSRWSGSYSSLPQWGHDMKSWGWLQCQRVAFLSRYVHLAHREAIHERCKAYIDDLRLSKDIVFGPASTIEAGPPDEPRDARDVVIES